MKSTSTFPLRLPLSIRAAVDEESKRDCVSVNQFIATAVAEKLAVRDAEKLFKKELAENGTDFFDRFRGRDRRTG